MDTTNNPSQQQPTLCANGCGFFGNPHTANYCSKCYKQVQQEKEAAAKPTVSEPIAIPQQRNTSASGSPMLGSSPMSSSPAGSSSSGMLSTSAPVGSSFDAAMLSSSPSKSSTKCGECGKKVGLTGFKCRCEGVFCGLHRYSDKHKCDFDYKAAARQTLAKENPVVVKDKIQRI